MADDNNPQGIVGQAASDAGTPGMDTDSRLDRVLGGLDDEATEQEPKKPEEEDASAETPEEDADEQETESDEEEESDTDETEDEAGEEDSEPTDSGRFVADNGKVRLDDGSVVTVAELKSGSLRHADYTRKTQELSANRKELESRQAEIAQRAQEADHNLNFAIQIAQANLPQPPDASALNSDDPLAAMDYMRRKQVYDERMGQVQQLLAMKMQQDERAQAERQQAMEGYISTERKALLDALPDLVNPKTGRPDQAKISALDNEIADVIQRYGFSPEDRHQVVDHRLIYMVHDLAAKAKKWDELQTKKPKALKKVAAKPVMKPAPQRDATAAKKSDWSKDKQRVRETGGRDSVALDRLLDNLIE